MNKKLGYKNILFSVFAYLLPFIMVFVVWSVYQSHVRHKTIIGQVGSSRRFMIGNNPNALGYAFPYPKVIEPAGFKFIISHPKRVFWLITQRFLYLWDFKKDVWNLRNPILEALSLPFVHFGKNILELPFYLVCFFTFFFGFLIKIRSDLNSSLISITSPFYLTFFASIIGPLFIFGSSRFLIPSIPIIVLFQAYAAIWLFQISKIQ
jgi:hypothetical protein